MDRGNPIAISIQKSLNSTMSRHAKSRAGQRAQYSLVSFPEYLPATLRKYGRGHFVPRRVYRDGFGDQYISSKDRIVKFWEEIMRL
jgi:hypothetical protein